MRKAGIVIAAAAATAGAAVAVLTTSETPPQPPTNAIVQLDPASPVEPAPQPEFGARVRLRGCGQVSAVTVKQATKGVLVVSEDAAHWYTKAVVLSGDTAPPVLKGRMDPGVWILFRDFQRPLKFAVYYASVNCPGTQFPFRWDASKVVVTVTT